MDRETYRGFTRRLAETLAAHEDVLGLVAVGSMAERDTMPDQWSDHDFWMVVCSGVQDRYRDQHDWLPDAPEIVWAFRETEHGVKVLYASGHLVEYAVFDLDELNVTRTNRYRVLFDRAGAAEPRATIADRMSGIEERTINRAAAEGDAYHAGQFLTNLLVGTGRYRRGEVLSAHRFVKAQAMQHLVILLTRHVASDARELADNIDPTRRFEHAYPELGRELALTLLQEVPLAAQGLLTIFEREVGAGESGVPPEALRIIKAQITMS